MALWKSVKVRFEAFTLDACTATAWYIYNPKIQGASSQCLQLLYRVSALTFTNAVTFLIIPWGISQHCSVRKLQSSMPFEHLDKQYKLHLLYGAVVAMVHCCSSSSLLLPFKWGSELRMSVTVLYIKFDCCNQEINLKWQSVSVCGLIGEVWLNVK